MSKAIRCFFVWGVVLLIGSLSATAQVEDLPIAASPEAVGIVPLSGDVNLWADNGGGSKYWRPDCDTLSNGNAIVLGGMRKAPLFPRTTDSENTIDMVAVFSPSGELLVPARTGFFTDAGEAWYNTICSTRNDDKFYGLCADTVGGRSGDRYVVHTIANPDHWPEAFPSHEAESSGDRHTAIQVVSNDGVPLTPIVNPYGDYSAERGLLRGGMVRFLSNGNIVVNYEDRQTTPLKAELYGFSNVERIVGAVILSPEGDVVKGPFAVCSPGRSENRFGLTSGDGWFVVRYSDARTGPTIVAYDNDGNELGDGNGRLFARNDIPELLGDGGNRGDPNGLEAVGDMLYITHRGADRKGYLSKIQVSSDGLSVIRTVRFTDHPRSTFEHNADLGVDSAGNVIVLWQDQAWEQVTPGRWEALARMFDADLEPLTSSFCMFEVGNNTDEDFVDPDLGPGRTKQCRIAMNDDIIIAIAHTNNVPYGDPESRRSGELYTYTYIARVLENPMRVSVRDWYLY